MPIDVKQSVPFWPQELIASYPYPILLLVKGSETFFKSITRASERTETDIRSELQDVTRGLLYVNRVREDGTQDYNLLVGDLKVCFRDGSGGNGDPRLYPAQSHLATNTDRARGLKQGIVLDFQGIEYCTGQQTRQSYETQNSDYVSGRHVEVLKSLLETSLLERAQDLRAGQDVGFTPTEAQQERLTMLSHFINSEYDLECLEQQQQAPYHYVSRQAASVRYVRRQFFDLTFGTEDYARLCQTQPKLLTIDSFDTGGEDISLEVVDFEPAPDHPVIRVSPSQQAEIRDIPENGVLKLMALPTLKNVRLAIVEQMQQGEAANPWLLPLLSHEHEHADFEAPAVEVGGGEHPPTASQQAAIEAGIATPDYALVLGPPGTGKTTVILEWVRYFVGQKKRVLVTSQNNKAVDNVLERLVEEPGFECLRIGNETKVSSSLSHVLLDNKVGELQQRLFEGNDPLIAYIDRAVEYVDALRVQHASIQVLFEQYQHSEQQVASTQQELVVSEAQQRTAIADVQRFGTQINSSNAKLAELERRKPQGLMKLFTGVFHWFSYKAENSKLVEANAAKQKALQQEQQHNAAVAKLTQQLTQQRSELTTVEQQLKAYDDLHPGPYHGKTEAGSQLPLLALPTLIELFAQASEADALNQTELYLTTLKQSVTDWFDKIRSERERSLYPLLLENVNVVGATCIGINTKELFRNIDFDVVIVDEAGQIQVHNLIVPLSRCDKAILVGDHKQIRPVVNDNIVQEIDMQFGLEEHERQLYEKSWFEILWQHAPESRRFMLDTQFRCPSEISDFVSKAFYDNRYYAGKNKLNSQPLLSFCPSPMVWLDTASINNNHEQRLDGKFNGNMTETNVVVEVLRRTMDEQPDLLSAREVGIIVPYQKHVEQIKRRIKTLQQRGELGNLAIPLNELVASVDSFQGQERSLIIFACSRSNKRGRVGFLSAWQRLNVAVTRAKKQLIIVGNSETMTYVAPTESGSPAPDLEFKQAMQQLVNQVDEANGLLPGFKFLPKKQVKKVAEA
ncbi:DEAD/DEAH box helicase [Aliidiomarina maris]|uniref:AAA domain-containing protein n=1 Tax=Aliidiomarina maris TaxID=531312 RepID=A0A327WPZ0_9GAMM|nr:ATP-binding protein [Aliidiomarina maris]RAJ92967.1 AAA domain-containing protein [Aliidiomarina maris]RUO18457.1 hypothetical protein CWE07_13975 [Aliidiomarina maris]